MPRRAERDPSAVRREKMGKQGRMENGCEAPSGPVRDRNKLARSFSYGCCEASAFNWSRMGRGGANRETGPRLVEE